MKTTRILSLAAAVLTLAACGNEEFIENNPGNEAAKPVPMTFTAGMPQTRTQLAAGNEVHWTAGDQIALWDGTAVQEFTATTINGSNATFTGTATPSSTYTALYPLSAMVSFDDSNIRFNLPAEQTAVAGTFANQLAPSLAKATGGSTDLVFENLCALVKFTVPADMAGKGTFTLVGGNATEALAGKYWMNYINGDQSSAEAATRVTLKGNFEAGEDYYFVVLPLTLTKGFSLLYEDSTGKLYRKATGNSVTLTAGRILNLGTLEWAGFEKAVVKAIYDKLESGTATENADGTVTLSDADLSALAAMTTLELPSGGVTSLAGLGYCTGLTTLKCANNQLTELYLSGLTQLTTLWCQMNQLTTLDVSGLTQLTDLWCFSNNLTALDITQLSSLNKIYCGNQNDERELTLTLTAAQEGVWNSWSYDSDNVRVKLNVVP
ncbi:leucine-rich repeat domain-containing protein [Mediterranea massiliensis]|uniref:leucine-rich repeat domain-containing protein n=1 Tax=Mediterranea massiliensis TaxID=1841865 RepID=UPI0025A4AF8B|nr:leucine-rich repeat domain-containing protein [Mediterranea massiliensis]MDM8339162.1 hypothetical protein [Mediterranea massiliensis]